MVKGAGVKAQMPDDQQKMKVLADRQHVQVRQVRLDRLGTLFRYVYVIFTSVYLKKNKKKKSVSAISTW